MRILTYVFETALSFSEPVTDHSFVLRCLPKSTNTQTVMDSQIFTFPRVTLDEQVDGFGNRIMVGYLPEGHDSFNFYTTGQVMVAGDMAGTTPCHPMFLQPTRLTQWTEEMANFAKDVIASDAGVLPQAQALCRAVHERFAYVPGVTSTSTTAAEAFGCETGVCQGSWPATEPRKRGWKGTTASAGTGWTPRTTTWWTIATCSSPRGATSKTAPSSAASSAARPSKPKK